MQAPWKTDHWFVSPWNYEPEAVGGASFSEKILIHDVTLRDGEQQAGVVFTKDEKVRIAEKLAEAGVHRIEAGMPAVSREDAEAVAEITKRIGTRCKVFAFCRCMKEDVDKAVDCGVSGVVVEIPASEHIIRNAYKWPLNKAIDLAVEATSYAKECGLYVVFFPIDGTRAELNWFLELINQVATHGHMDALGLVDTFGVLSPHAVPYFVRSVRRRVDKPLEAHFHNDFGLATANTVLALANGVEVAHTTVSGLGERAGNAPFEEVVLTLLTMYGVNVGVDFRKVYELSRLVRETSGQSFPSNRPIVGDMLYSIESGIISTWYRNCGQELPLELLPFHWDLVGHKAPSVVLGKNSGIDSVRLWVERMGMSHLSEDKLQELLLAVKNASIRLHRVLTEEEFESLVKEITSIVAG
ncbi:MAG: pyruvate carboxyltransferase [Bacillota bacterium]